MTKHFTTQDAMRLGKQLGIDWKKIDIDQFLMGLHVELEHGLSGGMTNVSNDDPLVTAKIALAHLSEIPDYYSRLSKMEKDASS